MLRYPYHARQRHVHALVAALAALALAAAAMPALAQGKPDIAWMAGGHNGGVPALALSPNQQTLATASFDTSAKLFDLPSGLLNHTLEGHSIAALAVAFSPDGLQAATGGYDGLVMLWNAQTGVRTNILAGHTDAVFDVAFSPDGTMLASASADGTIVLWNAATGAQIGVLAGHTGWVYSVTFSPDGAMLASGGGDGTIRTWRTSDGAHLGTLAGHTGYVLSVDFAPSGGTLLSTSNDNTTRLWRLSDGAEIGTYTGQTLTVYVGAFSPDGTRVASGAGDGTIEIHTVADGALERTITLPTGVLSLVYTSDGASLYVGCDDGTVSKWNTADGSFQGYVTAHFAQVNSVAVSPDGALAASASDDMSVRVHNVADGSTAMVIAAHGDGVTSVAFSPDSALLCTGSYDMTAAVWRLSDQNLILELAGHTDSVMCVAFSSDGSTIATGSSDTTIKLWRVSDGTEIGTISGHFGGVLGIAFSPDGQQIASVSADGRVRMWRVSDGQLIWSATASDAWAYCVAYSPDGTKVATGAAMSATGSLKLWNAADGAPLASTAGNVDPVRSVAFSPDGLVIVTGGNHDDTGRLQFWHATTLGLLQTYDLETASGTATNGVTAVAYAPNKTAVLYGRSDATMVLCANPFWPVPTVLEIPTIVGQIGEIVTLKADLTVSLSGAPVLGKTVTFQVEGTDIGSGVTNESGRAQCDFRIPEAQGVGDAVIGAAFAGDDAYDACSGEGTLTVTRANTNITADRVAGILGDTVTLRATLIRTTDDSPLGGRTITFKVESTDAGTAVSDEFGVATTDFMIPLNFGAGDRTITVSFAGDTNNKECTGYGTLVCSRRPTTMVAEDAAGQIGTATALQATLTFRGAPIADAPVAFLVDGTDAGLVTTNAEGIAVLAYLIPEASGAGSRTIRAEFAGDAVYDLSADEATLTVGVTNTFCYVPDLDRASAVGSDLMLRAYLYRQTDRGPVVGRTISFYVDGTPACTAVTIETGRATGSYLLPDDDTRETSMVRAVFSGDAAYNGCDGQGKLTVTVQKADTYMWVMPRIALRDTSTYLRAYLRRTTDWSWLPGKTVSMKVNGTNVGSAVTDSGGRASVLYYVAPDFPVGENTITATFAGDSLYKGSTADGWMFVF